MQRRIRRKSFSNLIGGFGSGLVTFVVGIVGPVCQPLLPSLLSWEVTYHLPSIGIFIVEDGIFEWPKEILLESEM